MRNGSDAVASTLSAIVAGDVGPYEGAVVAYRAAGDAERAASGEYQAAPLRWLLFYMIEHWEQTHHLAAPVEDEIRALAHAWLAGGEAAIRADWPRWGRWSNPHLRPLADRTGRPERPKVIRGALDDLQRVRGVGASFLVIGPDGSVRSLKGIERFTRMRGLQINGVKALRSLRELEGLHDLFELAIDCRSRELAEAVTDIDFSTLPGLRKLFLHGPSDPPLALSTSWLRGAQHLRVLGLGRFVPTDRTHAYLAAAPALEHLSILAPDEWGADPIEDVLGHVHLNLERSYALPPLPEGYYCLFTDDGNRAMHELVQSTIAGIESGDLRTLRRLERHFTDGIDRLHASGHTETGDTDVREAVIGALEPALATIDIDPEDTLIWF